MAAGDHLPPLGCTGALPVRRSAVHFLSSDLLVSGNGTGSSLALEDGSGSVCVVGANALRVLHVRAGAPLVEPERRCLRGRGIRRESLLHRDCVLAERVCRIARWGPAAASGAGRG